MVEQYAGKDLDQRISRLYGDVGRRVRSARRTARITQSQLAAAVGLTRTSITNLEAGRQHIPLHVLIWIAAILQVEVHDLLPDAATFDDLISLPDLTEPLANDRERMRDFVQSTIAKVAATSRTER